LACGPRGKGLAGDIGGRCAGKEEGERDERALTGWGQRSVEEREEGERARLELGGSEPGRGPRGGKGEREGPEGEEGSWAAVAHAGEGEGKEARGKREEGREITGPGLWGLGWLFLFPSFFPISFLHSNIQTIPLEFK
jgi:hypothetical protein